MSATDLRQTTIPEAIVKLPGWLCRADGPGTFYVGAGWTEPVGAEPEPETVQRVNKALLAALQGAHPGPLRGQGLVKVHVGERKCVTRMRPEFITSSVEFLRDRGADGVVAGDSTVAYTGPRGHRENPHGDAASYLDLATEHGWSPDGPAGVPFVVLDRPSTGVPDCFEFDGDDRRVKLEGLHHFHDVYMADGYAAADCLVNHAHLTLHGLAGVAGCVKSIAMGCAGLEGKLRMHQSLLPQFDEARCKTCGLCVKNCPEEALMLSDDVVCPMVDPDRCIGCGECEAVCAPGQGAVSLSGQDITDWQRGEQTLPNRMADYLIGMMNGKWDRVVHVLHMVSITPRCDCLDRKQKPMLQRDLGFLVGRNPFAIDMWAGRLLAEELNGQADPDDGSLLETAEQTAAYVREAYGIEPETSLEKMWA